MAAGPIQLKLLLQQRHLQTYGTFRREYDKAARAIDEDELVGTAPSRAQLYRWLSGDLKGLPYPHHCRVLEKMFPGRTAAQLFGPCEPPANGAEHQPADIGHLFELIAAGLSEPGAAPPVWGADGSERQAPGDQFAEANQAAVPAAVSSHAGPGIGSELKEVGQRLLTVGKARRLPPSELEQLARLAGTIVELDLKIDIDIASDGQAILTYRHELLNMSGKPLTKMARELWFEHPAGPLAITPASEADHRVVIQRVHETGNLVKFACQVSPPIRPGEVGVVGYACEGARFLDDHYWREALRRYTRHLTIRLRHRGGGQLTVCTAVEEHADGSENSATEELMWRLRGRRRSDHADA